MKKIDFLEILTQLAGGKKYEEVIKDNPNIFNEDIINSIKQAVEIIKNTKEITPKKNDEFIKIYIDGASRGNPGEASVGVVFKDKNDIVINEFYKAIGKATNNVAEYSALIYALENAKLNGHSNIKINADSELLIKQFKGEYAVKNPELRILFSKAHELLKHFNKVSFTHIPREENKIADKLANLALDLKLDKI